MKEVCKNCNFVIHYFHYGSYSDMYECHFFPPKENYKFVLVNPIHWCGQFKPKEN